MIIPLGTSQSTARPNLRSISPEHEETRKQLGIDDGAITRDPQQLQGLIQPMQNLPGMAGIGDLGRGLNNAAVYIKMREGVAAQKAADQEAWQAMAGPGMAGGPIGTPVKVAQSSGAPQSTMRGPGMAGGPVQVGSSGGSNGSSANGPSPSSNALVPASSSPVSTNEDPRLAAINGRIEHLHGQLGIAMKQMGNPLTSAEFRKSAMAQVSFLQNQLMHAQDLHMKMSDPLIPLQQRELELKIKSAEDARVQAHKLQGYADQIMARRFGAQPQQAGQDPQTAPAPSQVLSPTPNQPGPRLVPGGGAPPVAPSTAPMTVPGTPVAPGQQGNASPLPLNGPGQLPPGTYAGGMHSANRMAHSITPLSKEAQDAQDLILLGGLTGNRALESAGNHLLNADTTLENRKKFSTDMGGINAARADRKEVGISVLNSAAQLRHSFDIADEDDLLGAIGPYNAHKAADDSNNWMPSLSTIAGMTPPQAAAAAKQMSWFNPKGYLPQLHGRAASWNLQNLFTHDVNGITTSMMSGAGKGVTMTDKAKGLYESAMRDFAHATNRESASEILDHAIEIIRNDYGLSKEESDLAFNSRLTEIKREKAEKAKTKLASDASKSRTDYAVGAIVNHPEFGPRIKQADGKWHPVPIGTAH